MRLKATTPADSDTIRKWIDADEHHVGVVSPEFFYQPRDGVSHFTVCSDNGEPIFFVTLEAVVRIHVQFDPAKQGSRTARALLWFARMLYPIMKRLNVREIITESCYPPLINFMLKTFYGRKLENDYSTRIETLENYYVRSNPATKTT